LNAGGGPERDETGLPPVDVQIPDDARELDRDVQAYRREQRAERRRVRSRRLRPGQDGMVMPLLICCLVFALISGTLLTLFTATSIDQNGLSGVAGKSARSGTGSSAVPSTVATTTPAPPQLDEALVEVGGRLVAVKTIGPAILLVVPVNCGCDPVVADVASLATTSHEHVFLVAQPADVAGAQRLASQLGHGLQSATDQSGALAGGDYAHTGLTAIAVATSGLVTYEDQLQPGADLTSLVDSI
jgi:hypothetical protein